MFLQIARTTERWTPSAAPLQLSCQIIPEIPSFATVFSLYQSKVNGSKCDIWKHLASFSDEDNNCTSANNITVPNQFAYINKGNKQRGKDHCRLKRLFLFKQMEAREALFSELYSEISAKNLNIDGRPTIRIKQNEDTTKSARFRLDPWGLQVTLCSFIQSASGQNGRLMNLLVNKRRPKAWTSGALP